MKRANKDDLDAELFEAVQETARRFVNEIEKLGRRNRRLYGVVADLGRLRRKVEDKLMESIDDGFSFVRRKRKNNRTKKRVERVELVKIDLGNETLNEICGGRPVRLGRVVSFFKTISFPGTRA